MAPFKPGADTGHATADTGPRLSQTPSPHRYPRDAVISVDLDTVHKGVDGMRDVRDA